MDKEFDGTLQGVFSQVMRLHFLRTHSLLEKTGVYPGQPPLLYLLYKKNGRSQKELAEKMGVKPATIAVMIKRMEKNELLERKQDEKDQRVSRIFITDKGKEVCKNLIVIHKEIEEECFRNFTEEEKIILRRLLMQVRDNLQTICNGEKVKCPFEE
ncbi:DNA-binding transcriptional regulator, MarR family [Clostridium collagenovorans DSM 3089]|uniref:DNA-binding transcriptional regulator, MarR family n=1 Tax=Clostridium collagenovorans DSM 3089 TaxID=1121306 RepID=A0A1M5VGJ2_9CLOT|nr:MarR family transcriptional regulator [Clostridium collagenovorans]SHH74224.1 DNA-binding transcriptional regulator, MarR family [Clostridium collagenovorans DSM 3089]